MSRFTKQEKSSAATVDKKSISAAERRYRTAIHRIRSFQRTNVGRRLVNKAVQVELAHLVNKIESYGFSFFPNHYVFEEILVLEGVANTLEAEIKNHDATATAA